MRIEQFPLVLAAIIGIVGVALLADAFMGDDGRAPRVDRRRRVRAERHRWGEALVGLGLLACAAGLAGRDSWSYGTTAMIGGVVLLVVGAVLNRRLLGQLLSSHGAARRQTADDAPVAATSADGGKGAGAPQASVDADDRPQPPSREAPTREVPSRETPPREAPPREAPPRDVPPREVPPREVPPRIR